MIEGLGFTGYRIPSGERGLEPNILGWHYWVLCRDYYKDQFLHSLLTRSISEELVFSDLSFAARGDIRDMSKLYMDCMWMI